MWTLENQPRYDRSKLRYPSDVTDEEWALTGPLIPPAKKGGNKRTVDVRAVINGVMYILSTGCQWPALPKDPRRAAQTLDRRTNHRLAHAMSAPGQGLGVPEPHKPHLSALGVYSPHASKAMSRRQMTPDRLLAMSQSQERSDGRPRMP